MEKILKVGVIGLGEIAQTIHLPTLLNMSDRFEIVAVCDLSTQLVQYIGKRYQVENLYTDYNDLLAQKDLDAVLVFNSDEYHTDTIIAAANRHKHVFVEKPMCFTPGEADRIIAARNAADVHVMVGYMRRFAPAFLQGVEEVKRLDEINYARIRSIIGQNPFFIGQLSSHVVRYNDITDAALKDRKERFKALMREATGGDSPQIGDIYNTLCGLNGHDFSAMREMLGFPRQVIAAAKGPGQFLTAIFEYDGYNATFETGVDHQGRFDAHLEVFGRTKTVRVQYDTPYIQHLPIQLFVSQTVGEEYREEKIRPTFRDPYTLELEAFYDAVTKGQCPKTTPEDFKQDLLLCRMIMDALKNI